MTRFRHRIVVEGMDGSGKTTLIQQLTDRNPDFFIVPGIGPVDDITQRIMDLLDAEDTGRVPVHDRLFFSELVYGPVIRGAIAIDHTALQNFAWFLRQTAFLIYCRPHTQVLNEHLNKKPQMPGVVSRQKELVTAYDHVMEVEKQWFGPRFFHYSWPREGELQRLEATLAGYLRT